MVAGADVLFRFGKWPDRLVHHQPRRLQDGDAVTQIADILSQKAGAHFRLPALEVKMIAATKRSLPEFEIIKFF